MNTKTNAKVKEHVQGPKPNLNRYLSSYTRKHGHRLDSNDLNTVIESLTKLRENAVAREQEAQAPEVPVKA